MKTTKILFAIALFSFTLLQSCSKDEVTDPNANLTGAFTVSAVAVDGVSSTGSGTLNFVAADKTGDLDMKYRVDVNEYSVTGDFIYTATSSLITLNPGTADEQKWTRITDAANEQKIQFTQNVNNKNRVVAITFKK
jgi:hypothetical protein